MSTVPPVVLPTCSWELLLRFTSLSRPHDDSRPLGDSMTPSPAVRLQKSVRLRRVLVRQNRELRSSHSGYSDLRQVERTQPLCTLLRGRLSSRVKTFRRTKTLHTSETPDTPLMRSDVLSQKADTTRVWTLGVPSPDRLRTVVPGLVILRGPEVFLPGPSFIPLSPSLILHPSESQRPFRPNESSRSHPDLLPLLPFQDNITMTNLD